MSEAGIDLGSRFVKICVKDGQSYKFYKYNTIDFYKNFIKKDSSGNIRIEHEIVKGETIDRITATGYGRNLMNFCNSNIISEVKAHFKGAKFQTGLEDFVLIDIGGQDSKVIKSTRGFIDDFVMNDKCAASTGRFLENSANILQISVDKLAGYTENPCILSSTCAIFSESEIIGKIAEGYSIAEIAAGINLSVAKRLVPLIRRFAKSDLYAAGGVASLYGVKYFLESLLDKQVNLLKDYQYNAALGCVV